MFMDLRALAVHPDGTEIIASGLRTAGGFAYVVPRVTSVVRSLPDGPLGGPAYLSGPPSGARYAITTATSLIIAQPDRPSDQPLTIPAAPTTAPIVLGGDHFASMLAAIAYGSTGPSSNGLSIAYVDPSMPAPGRVEHVPTTERPLGEPIAYASSTGVAGFFQIRENNGTHVLGGCTLGPRPAPNPGHTCTPINVSATLPATAPARATPITGYWSGSATPDLIIATQTPARLVFVPPSLATVGPVINLTGAAVATPALSERFLARYNVRGSAVFVPHAGGLELVVWQRPPVAGPDDVLWRQSRGGPRRAGRL
jgi:hypothetical protein